jgi:3-dehydroshikimate dehydratase
MWSLDILIALPDNYAEVNFMLKTGLVSVTFRQLKPEQIIQLVRQSGLEGVEWGGDIHVPHGDLAAAKAVSAMTADAGLKTASYGSYYNVGCEDPDLDLAKKVIETAVLLDAPTVRMWAGEKGSANADEAYRQRVVELSRAIAELAGQAGMTISYEFHGESLTDTNDSARRFYEEIGDSRVKAYWQPDYNARDLAYRLEGLESMKPYLANIHVFNWRFGTDSEILRNPLIDGEQELKLFFNSVRGLAGSHYAMIEFVKGDSPEQFLQDAKALRGLVDF